MLSVHFTQLMQSLPFFFKGLWGTIAVSGLSLLAGTVVGLLWGILRASRYRTLRIIIGAWVDLIRGTPFLVQAVDAVVALPAAYESGLEAAWRTVESRYEERRYDIEHPVLAPAEVFFPPEEWSTAAAVRPQVWLEAPGATAVAEPSAAADDVVDCHATAADFVRLDARREESIRGFASRLDSHAGRVLLVAESPGRRELRSSRPLEGAEIPRQCLCSLRS